MLFTKGRCKEKVKHTERSMLFIYGYFCTWLMVRDDFGFTKRCVWNCFEGSPSEMYLHRDEQLVVIVHDSLVYEFVRPSYACGETGAVRALPPAGYYSNPADQPHPETAAPPISSPPRPK